MVVWGGGVSAALRRVQGDLAEDEIRMRTAAFVLTLCLLASPAHASSPVVHAVAGDLIGAWAARYTGEWAPVVSALVGFASHPALDAVDHDYTPDWTTWHMNRARLLADAPHLLVQAAGLLALALNAADEPDPDVRTARIAGIVGALLPDLIEVPHSLADPSSWHRGDHILPWHRAGRPRRDQPWHVTAAISTAAVSLRLSLTF